VVTFLILENVWGGTEKDFEELSNNSRFLYLFDHVLLIWRKDNNIDKSLCQEIEGTPSNLLRVDLFLKNFVYSNFELIPYAHLN